MNEDDGDTKTRSSYILMHNNRRGRYGRGLEDDAFLCHFYNSNIKAIFVIAPYAVDMQQIISDVGNLRVV